ncbi:MULTISPECIES: dCTP deaminase [Priestia]|uniref:dCTP deaminase n=1 Tax=Priestia TaxID=2800373 RepID=UPI000AF039F8|nr:MULTISPECIES: dCTP deaminase [Priestia]MDP1441921.1 dCTP deaminase [Priestia megaterium]MDP1471014.1 dCTP deaminase [Priestia megaterium]
MMLSDRELRLLAERERLVSPFVPENCQGATINLTLDKKIKKYISDKNILLGEEVTPDQYEEIDIKDNDFYLEPNCSVLVQSVEYFKVPDNMCGQIYERYSIKLLGLMISPASYMNPGYEGRMSFVAYNMSSKPIRLTPGVKFSQLAISKLSSDPETPYHKQDAKYQGTKEVSISKLHLDEDIQDFLRVKGVGNVSVGAAKELGDFLMSKIDQSAKKIADELREKFGDPSER